MYRDREGLAGEHFLSQDKIIDFSAAAEKIKQLLSKGVPVTYVDGVFDLLHGGHLEYLELAKQTGGVVIVGVKPDSMVARVKGDDRPIRSQADRQKLLAGLAAVDYVTVLPDSGGQNASEWRTQVLKLLTPTQYAIMYTDASYHSKRADSAGIGINLRLLFGKPKVESTTAIVGRIKAGGKK